MGLAPETEEGTLSLQLAHGLLPQTAYNVLDEVRTYTNKLTHKHKTALYMSERTKKGLDLKHSLGSDIQWLLCKSRGFQVVGNKEAH